MEFSQEQLEKASKAKSAEELISIAKEDGITLTNDDANKYFKMLNAKEGEIAEEELSNVAGGTCYSKGTWGPKGYQHYAIVTVGNTCKGFYWSCVFPERKGKCPDCAHHFTNGLTMYCSVRTKEDDPYK